MKISAEDRDQFFDRSWGDVIIEITGAGSTSISLSDAFWRQCSELRSAAVGRWLLTERLAPWPKGEPPTFALTALEGNRFKVDRK